ncbi:MAG: GNAT family protein [Chloroflexi bacterium]|nr:GNAT family protein [Chloroflexota bacterium]
MDTITLDASLSLRPVTPADERALVQLVDDARRQADPLLPWWTEQPTDADARRWSRRNDVGDDRWLVVRRDETIGSAGVGAGRTPGEGVLSCWLAPRFDDFATRERVCETLVARAFGALGYERLHFVCGEDDQQSVALAGQLGFAVEQREQEPALYVSGGYRTVLTFVLGRGDWRPRAGEAE